MNTSSLTNSPPLLDVWNALGGGPIRTTGRGKGRGAAFWRNSRDLNVAIDLNRGSGVWFDHVSGVGGGPVSLVAEVFKCSRTEASRWLGERFGHAPRDAASREERISAEAFDLAQSLRAALCWRLEAQLQRAKERLDYTLTHARELLETDEPSGAVRDVLRLERRLQKIHDLSARTAVVYVRRVSVLAPALFELLHSEAEQAEISLALIIAAMGKQ